MTLKGDFSILTSYSIGDVAAFQDNFYYRFADPGSGIVPTDTARWEKLPKWLAQAADLTMDGVGIAKDYAKGLVDAVKPDEKTLRIKSSTASSTKLFNITVVDNGTISATEYTPT